MQKHRHHTRNPSAALMRALDGREIRLGLYFPLLKGWREWKFRTG